MEICLLNQTAVCVIFSKNINVQSHESEAHVSPLPPITPNSAPSLRLKDDNNFVPHYLYKLKSKHVALPPQI